MPSQHRILRIHKVDQPQPRALAAQDRPAAGFKAGTPFLEAGEDQGRHRLGRPFLAAHHGEVLQGGEGGDEAVGADAGLDGGRRGQFSGMWIVSRGEEAG